VAHSKADASKSSREVEVNTEDPLAGLRSELRRGVLVMAVLSRLRTEHYGYSLRKDLGDYGLNIEESTLYPLIRRLEKQGLLESEWREEGGRRKRFYRLSPMGETTLRHLQEEWEDVSSALERIMGTESALGG